MRKQPVAFSSYTCIANLPDEPVRRAEALGRVEPYFELASALGFTLQLEARGTPGLTGACATLPLGSKGGCPAARAR